MFSKMKRGVAIDLLRVAGYHNDQRAFVRLYVENRISRKVAAEEFNRGYALRRSGVDCGCFECKGSNP